MDLSENLSSMYQGAKESASKFGNKALETAKEVSDNDVFKAVVFDKDDPVDVALTAAGAVTGGGSLLAKGAYKGAKVAKAATKIFKSEKAADAALTIGKKVESGASGAMDLWKKGKEFASGKLSEAADSASGVFNKGKDYVGKKVEQGKEAASKIVSEGIEKAGELGSKAKEGAKEVFDRTKDYANKKIEQTKEAATDIWNKGKEAAGKKVDEIKEGAKDIWNKGKKKADDLVEAGKEKAGELWDKGKNLASKTFKRIGGIGAGIAAGAGLANIFGGGGKSGSGEGNGDGESGEQPIPNIVTAPGKISPAGAITPNITPTENIDLEAAQMNPTGEGGIGDAKSILEKIYMVLQQTNRTVEKISADTGNLVRYSSMKDVSADLAGANATARMGEGGMVFSGGSSSSPMRSYSSGNGGDGGEKDGFLMSALKTAGGTALAASGLYGLGGGFDETPKLDEIKDNISDKISGGISSVKGAVSSAKDTISSGYSKVKGFLGFGEENKGPSTEEIKKLSREIMPQTTKSLEKAEQIGLDLGSVSAKFESGSRGSSAVGYDVKGGTSYGTYQIASKTGTMDNFLKHLEKTGHGDVAEQLRQSGPSNTGGKGGAFADKWKELVKEGKLTKEMEHEYIKKTHYDPAAKKAEELGFKTDDAGIKDAIWSGSVQHGRINKILSDTSKIEGFKDMSSEDQIKAYYKVRSEYAKQNSPENLQPRYNQEVKAALAKSKAGQSQNSTLLAENKSKTENLQPAEKSTPSEIKSAPEQEPIVIAENKSSSTPTNNSPAPANKGTQSATTPIDGKQSVSNTPPLGNVRDDDPLILSMQYSNLRTV